jgi:hypothetical protein
MKLIRLTQGQFAKVDDEDYFIVSKFTWCAVKKHNKDTFYAYNGKHKMYLHRLILGLDNNYETDHIDGNGLNNQRSNLRKATSAQNNYNRKKLDTPFTSIYKGVHFSKSRRKWIAMIKSGEHHLNLGGFEFEFDAASAYDDAAKQLFGEFAKLNFK